MSVLDKLDGKLEIPFKDYIQSTRTTATMCCLNAQNYGMVTNLHAEYWIDQEVPSFSMLISFREQLDELFAKHCNSLIIKSIRMENVSKSCDHYGRYELAITAYLRNSDAQYIQYSLNIYTKEWCESGIVGNCLINEFCNGNS